MGGTTVTEAGGISADNSLRAKRNGIIAAFVAGLDALIDAAGPTESAHQATTLEYRFVVGFDGTEDVSSAHQTIDLATIEGDIFGATTRRQIEVAAPVPAPVEETSGVQAMEDLVEIPAILAAGSTISAAAV